MADPSETTQVTREPSDVERELVDALRTLADQVARLQTDVQALRSEARGLPPRDPSRPGWDDGAPVVREGPAWLRSVDSPRPRRLPVPWLLLEIAFLVAVAALAAVAGLDPYAIGVVMLAAWALVASGEWLAARAEKQRYDLVYGSRASSAAPVPDDSAWFGANGDETLLDAPSAERPPPRLPPAE